jgi:predicted membrane-bound spermidine synthase
MDLLSVIALLSFDAALLLGGSFFFDKPHRQKDSVFLALLFFCSGMPALVYQIVWQRALFAIYGVNAQSVAVVVTAFMVGLGIGSLVGGSLATRLPKHGILIFGLAELGVAVFGLTSLRVFHWAAAYTAGTNLVFTMIFTLLLLFIPTVLMGATLPLLVEHLVLRTGRVGCSVATLYFVNTFGSAVACYLCATLLLRNFGQSGSVTIAACVNTAVGATAYLYSRATHENVAEHPRTASQGPSTAAIPLQRAMLLAGLSGFIALGFEIIWFRVFSLASSDRAPAFALLLCTYLAGIAAGSMLSEKLTAGARSEAMVSVVGGLLVLSGALSAYLPPLVASLMARKIPFLASAPAFFVTAGLIGSVLPLLCQLAVSPQREAGREVSLIYLSNIVGSGIGSLGVGFVLMHHFGLKPMSVALGLFAVVAGSSVLICNESRVVLPRVGSIALVLASLIAAPFSLRFYSLLFERLVFGDRPEASVPFARIVENRNGMIGVTRGGAVFGEGVYDGYFNIDPTNDVNLVVRAYLLSAFCPSPKRILVIGLASGSWGQILANHPEAEALDAVEINPGYLQLIPEYPMVRSFLQNPKVHVYVDDGRRWLNAHSEARYDAIIANTTFNWRDHSTGLLSVEFLKLIRTHLNPGGIYYFNSTESDETFATALRVFPYGLRVINFLAVSDSPISVDKERLSENLGQYKIDGRLVFDPQSNPRAGKVLETYLGLINTLNRPPQFMGMEFSDSLRARLGRRLTIRDDNMGLEWRNNPSIPWH